MCSIVLIQELEKNPHDISGHPGIRVRCRHHPRALGIMTCSWWRSPPPPLCWENRAGVCSPLQRFGHFCVFETVYSSLFVGQQLLLSALFGSRHDTSLISSVSLLFPLKPVLSSSEACVIISNGPLMSCSQLRSCPLAAAALWPLPPPQARALWCCSIISVSGTIHPTEDSYLCHGY